MIERYYGNIFRGIGKVNALCITTNTTLRRNGDGICGAGVALQAKIIWPDIEEVLGNKMKECPLGQDCVLDLFSDKGTHILAFPTKYHWKEKANLDLIDKSAKMLVEIANINQWKSILVPAPGCGYGGLSWDKEVKPILQDHFDNRFEVYHIGGSNNKD